MDAPEISQLEGENVYKSEQQLWDGRTDGQRGKLYAPQMFLKEHQNRH